jgi:hypothetical protein
MWKVRLICYLSFSANLKCYSSAFLIKKKALYVYTDIATMHYHNIRTKCQYHVC